MKSIPQVKKYMTVVPLTIDVHQSIEKAQEIMQKENIRHLPVTKVGELYGIITDKDVRSVMAFAGADPKTVKVGDICEEQVYSVDAGAPIDEVAETMAEKKLGSALVVDNKKLVGIFTVTDSLRALAEIARQRFHN